MSGSTIGQGTFVRGNVRGDGDLDVLGRVEGAVEVTGDLLIGESALVKSDISGRRVVVRGAVAGSVSGSESIVLEQGARVVGDLSAPSIGIRPGALVRGNVATVEAGEHPQPARRAAAPAARPAPAPARVSAIPTARPMPSRPAPAPRPIAAPRAVAAPAPPPPPPPSQTEASGPPPPVVPALKKGAKAQLRRKGAR